MKIKRRYVLLIFNLFTLVTVYAQLSGGGEANPYLLTNEDALEEFRDNRFGMFIHWGPVTLRGEEIGWSRKRQIPAEDYDNLYKEFNPVLFDAASWVRIAKQAGMRYLIITTKHHDGFSLWDSQYSNYDMTNTPYGKGVVKSLAEECKIQGLDFGIYYSILDWWHPDYPMTRTETTYVSRSAPETIDPAEESRMEQYQVYMKNQLKELIDLVDPSMIWFDGGWEWPWTHNMGMDLYAYLRGLKDDILINNRIDKALQATQIRKITNPEKYAGDYQTPEQRIGGFNNDIPWETCMTIATQWSWKPNDKIKSVQECIHTLLRTVGGDGNLLFNVGPMPDGRIEHRQVDTLKEMGEWLKVNGESIYGTRGGPYMPNDYMVSTRKGNNIYLHLLEHTEEDIKLPFPNGIEIRKSYFLENGVSIPVQQGEASLSIKLPKTLPNDVATVIVLELDRSASDIEFIRRINY